MDLKLLGEFLIDLAAKADPSLIFIVLAAQFFIFAIRARFNENLDAMATGKKFEGAERVDALFQRQHQLKLTPLESHRFHLLVVLQALEAFIGDQRSTHRKITLFSTSTQAAPTIASASNEQAPIISVQSYLFAIGYAAIYPFFLLALNWIVFGVGGRLEIGHPQGAEARTSYSDFVALSDKSPQHPFWLVPERLEALVVLSLISIVLIILLWFSLRLRRETSQRNRFVTWSLLSLLFAMVGSKYPLFFIFSYAAGIIASMFSKGAFAACMLWFSVIGALFYIFLAPGVEDFAVQQLAFLNQAMVPASLVSVISDLFVALIFAGVSVALAVLTYEWARSVDTKCSLYGRWGSCGLLLLIALLPLLLAPLFLPPDETHHYKILLDGSLSIFLIILVLPISNALCDWLSLAATRWLMGLSAASSSNTWWKHGLYLVADLIFAFCFTILVTLLVIFSLKASSNYWDLVRGTSSAPDWSHVKITIGDQTFWLYIMLYSTLLPTLAHFYAWSYTLSRMLLDFDMEQLIVRMDEGVSDSDVRRSAAKELTQFQVVRDFFAAIFFSCFLIVLISLSSAFSPLLEAFVRCI